MYLVVIEDLCIVLSDIGLDRSVKFAFIAASHLFWNGNSLYQHGKITKKKINQEAHFEL